MKLGAIGLVRLIVMLRRIWRTLEVLTDIEQARLDLERDRMALEFPKWSQAGGKLPAPSKKAAISVVSVEDLNKAWDLSHYGQFDQDP